MQRAISLQIKSSLVRRRRLANALALFKLPTTRDTCHHVCYMQSAWSENRTRVLELKMASSSAPPCCWQKQSAAEFDF